MNTDGGFRADSIGKSFGAKKTLSAATLIAPPGKIGVLLGRNGAGKSTLLRIAAGLLKADFGLIVYKGQRLERPAFSALARMGLFYLPDRSLLWPSLSLRHHLRALAARFPVSETMIEQVLKQLRLEDLTDQRTMTLSPGERARAGIALAMSRHPDCLLSDEPFRDLAPKDVEALSECFQQLARQGGSIVITGHDVSSLFNIADEVVWLTAGTTHFLGGATEARAHHQFRREYLGLGPAL